MPVAGDDKTSKAIVLKLVDELGFDGVDAGGLDESWRQRELPHSIGVPSPTNTRKTGTPETDLGAMNRPDEVS